MKTLFSFLLCSLFLNISVASAQIEVVSAVKNDLVARGISLAGPCGAFEITKRVAWILRDHGVYLLSKPSGNNCQGYSVDYIVFTDASGRDILADGGGENTPQWSSEPNEPSGTFVGRRRDPFDPGDTITPTPPPIEPVPPQTDCANYEATNLCLQILEELRAHEAAEAIERAKAEGFRQAVGSEYRKFFTFVAKYILPAVGAIFVGREMGQ
jgi:hypothetical protein